MELINSSEYRSLPFRTQVSKIRCMESLSSSSEQWKERGMKVGLVCGCFDILHIGHIELFRFAKQNSDILIVGTDSDASVRNAKGKGRPIHRQDIRLEQLSELQSIDYVFMIDEIECFGDSGSGVVWEKMLERISPDVLFTNKHALHVEVFSELFLRR